MSFNLFEEVALARDLPEEGLRRGDVATVVERIPSGGAEDGYALELFNSLGQTIKVIVVPESALEALTADEVWSVRPLKRA